MPEKEISHTKERYAIKGGAEEFPLMLILSLVYVCNSKCPNCPYSNCDIQKTYDDAPVMPEDIFRRIVEESGRYNAYLRITAGGEPMLHPKAVDLMAYAKRQGTRIGLITNGSLFDRKKLTSLIEAGVDNIEFSIDAGDEETYKRVRPGLDWKRVNENVRMAADIRDHLKAPTRIIVSVINQKDVDIKAADGYWGKIADKVQIRKYLTWGYNKDHSADPTPYLPLEEAVPCPWLFERFNIDTRGDVTVCGEDIAFGEKFGNVMEHSIKELWRHPKMEYFRKTHLGKKGAEIPICGKCDDWQYRSWNYNYWKVVDDAEKTKGLRSKR
ncbi:MAG: radical SAM protein [Candidatus Omnitrophica bacterium]|nr:radical SAM protein [Candidatus Omnitrophota bacterium]